MVASPTAKLPNLIDRQYFRLYGMLAFFHEPAKKKKLNRNKNRCKIIIRLLRINYTVQLLRLLTSTEAVRDWRLSPYREDLYGVNTSIV